MLRFFEAEVEPRWPSFSTATMWNEALNIPSFSSSSSSFPGFGDCKTTIIGCDNHSRRPPTSPEELEMFSFTDGLFVDSDNWNGFRLQHTSLPPLTWSPADSLNNISASRAKPILEKRMREPSGDQDEIASRGPKKQKQKQKQKPKPVKKQVRRSQKLGDQITALQQLVSPFGKTDTASVLQEAAIHIKNLHEEIQILMMAPPVGIKLQSGREKPGLHQRGLCLVPVSEYSSIRSANQRNDL